MLAVSDGGYTTNLPLADVTGGKAWVAVTFDDAPLAPEHGGPARLLVPHLYFWKSARWIRQFRLMEDDDAGFWESRGYHNYGDPGASSGTAVTREWRRGSRTISSGADRMAARHRH